jgi:hypothetical protein
MKRREQKIEESLTDDVLNDEAFTKMCAAVVDAGKKEKESNIPMVPALDVSWERTHNHRVPINKKVFGHITYGDVERAIWKSEGMLTNVARNLSISVYQVKSILSKYKLLRQDFEEYREALLDEAEMCLRAKIRRGDTSATIFYLKCVGKARGYEEYSKGKVSKGSVRIKMVPATDANVKKLKKEAAAPAAAQANVIPLFKKAEGDVDG